MQSMGSFEARESDFWCRFLPKSPIFLALLQKSFLSAARSPRTNAQFLVVALATSEKITILAYTEMTLISIPIHIEHYVCWQTSD